jgi:polyisoprenoid-binding protein YceI
MSIHRLFVLAMVALAAGPAMAADTLVIDRGHSEAGFQVRHLFTNVRGRFGTFEGTIVMDPAKPEASSVAFTIDASSIDTDNTDRDKHLRSPDFFDVANHPSITFTSQSIRSTGKDRYAVTGTLTMRGVAKTITLPVSYLGAGKDPWGNERAGFSTAITLNRKDYGINWNKSLDNGGLLLGDDVAVTIDLEAVKQAPKQVAKQAG